MPRDTAHPGPPHTAHAWERGNRALRRSPRPKTGASQTIFKAVPGLTQDVGERRHPQRYVRIHEKHQTKQRTPGTCARLARIQPDNTAATPPPRVVLHVWPGTLEVDAERSRRVRGLEEPRLRHAGEGTLASPRPRYEVMRPSPTRSRRARPSGPPSTTGSSPPVAALLAG